MLRVLSLGWGVQSWTLAAMSALGVLEPLDLVVHADTTWESAATYRFAAAMTPWLRQRGVPLVTVKPGEPERILTHIPAYTYGSRGEPGQIHRQCTKHWKIQPVRAHIRRELAERGLKVSPGAVELWIGISVDEWRRAKDSDVAYIRHRFPLLERNLTRTHCTRWLHAHNLPVPEKSACVFCPYRSTDEWRALKRQRRDFQAAVDVDRCLRHALPPQPLYVHPARKPLELAVQIPEDVGLVQNGLFEQCDSGFCSL